MARTKRSASLDSRTKRLALPLEKFLCEQLRRGGYLLYRRPRSRDAGTWYARWRNEETKKTQQVRLGEADDYQEADGVRVFTFAQAQVKAEAWFKACVFEASREAGDDVVPAGVYTVRDAIRDYLEDAQRRGMKGLLVTTQFARARILPELGDVPVARLTRRRIEAWHLALAESPRRTNRRPSVDEDEAPRPPVPLTEEARRARRATANRVLTILRAALNHALALRKVGEPACWREVKPFKGVEVSRIRYLSIEEQRRLVRACDSEFRPLVQAALFTGARYGELTRLRVQDFNPRSGTLFIETSKSGFSRHVRLTEEAKDWFLAQTLGRPVTEPLLTRSSVHRTKRRHLIEAQAWAPYDQVQRMAETCTRAGLPGVTFHELRHTYASLLVNQGVALAFVAAQLGHRSTRMVEKYYGHLCPDALAESIRTHVPVLGLADPGKVVPLQARQVR